MQIANGTSCFRKSLGACWKSVMRHGSVTVYGASRIGLVVMYPLLISMKRRANGVSTHTHQLKLM